MSCKSKTEVRAAPSCAGLTRASISLSRRVLQMDCRVKPAMTPPGWRSRSRSSLPACSAPARTSTLAIAARRCARRRRSHRLQSGRADDRSLAALRRQQESRVQRRQNASSRRPLSAQLRDPAIPRRNNGTRRSAADGAGLGSRLPSRRRQPDDNFQSGNE